LGHAEILGIGRGKIVHRSGISVPIMNGQGKKFRFFKFGMNFKCMLSTELSNPQTGRLSSLLLVKQLLIPPTFESFS
jgi:hypothetical protein